MLSALVEKYSIDGGDGGLRSLLLRSASHCGDPSRLLWRRLFYDFAAQPRFDTTSTQRSHSRSAVRIPKADACSAATQALLHPFWPFRPPFGIVPDEGISSRSGSRMTVPAGFGGHALDAR